MSTPVRCDACDRRIVVGPVISDDDGNRFGPRCGRARGLAPERRRRARKPAPVRAEQPALAGWDELTADETNEESEAAT